MSFDRVAVMRAETKRFAEVLTDVAGRTQVPTCPGWNADDLLWHLTEVHLFWSAVIASGATSDEQVEEIERSTPLRPRERREALELLSRATDELGTALSSGDDADSAWSWFPDDQSLGFTRRMQAHEATMHRVDAELTAGVPVSSISRAVSLDGLDHVIDVMWNWVPASGKKEAVGVIELAPEGADPRRVELYLWTGKAWGRDFDQQISARRAPEDASAGASISGSPKDLDKLVWGRPGSVKRAGDDQVLAHFEELLAFGLQ